MKLQLEEAHIWYDVEKWDRNKFTLKVGSVATVHTSGFHPEHGKYFQNTEFLVTNRDELALQLTGTVTSIQMVVADTSRSKDTTDVNKEHSTDKIFITEDLPTPGCIKGYDVTMRDISIKSIRETSNHEVFKIDMYNFSYGNIDMVLRFDGVNLPFSASYIGDMPLYSLINVIDSLDYQENIENSRTCHSSAEWHDEPGELFFDFVRNIGKDSLSISLKYSNESPYSDSLVNRHWNVSMSYKLFRNEVIRTALYCLKTYGLRGCYENWMDSAKDFPLSQLIRLLDSTNYNDHTFGDYENDISDDLGIS